MVDSIKPTFSTYATQKGPYKVSQSVQAVSPPSEDKPHQGPQWDRVDRRRSGDRRQRRLKHDQKFEMRRSRGRRRSDQPRANIDVKV